MHDGRRVRRSLIAALHRPWWGPALALVVLLSAAVPDAGHARFTNKTSENVAKVTKPAKARAAVGFGSARTGWAGTWTVNGRPGFGIDLDSLDPPTAGGYASATARSLRPQVGWTKDHRKGGAAGVKGHPLKQQTLGAIAYLADRYASTRVPLVAAAAEHAVRLLTVGDKRQVRREGDRWAAVVKAHKAAKAAYSAVAADVRDHAGPYALTSTWATAPTASAPGILAVLVRSAAGKPMPGVRLVTHATPTPAQGDVTSTTDANGQATVTVPVTAKGALTVRLTAQDLPAAAPIVYTPKQFTSRRSPDRLAQRLVGAAARAAVSATATATVAPVVPAVTTRSAPVTPVLASRLTDSVTLTGTLTGYDGKIVASLWGPFSTSPSAQDCDQARTPLAARVSVPARGDGTVTTPAATISSPGYYTWTEDVPGTALQAEVLTPCGDPAETFTVAGTPALDLAVGGDPAPGNDLDAQLTVAGSFPGLAADATLTLYGPFAAKPTPLSCTPRVATDVSTATLHGDGTVTATTVTVSGVGYYTWVVILPAVIGTQAAASITCAAPEATFAVTRPDLGALDVTTTGSVGATDPGPAPPPGGPALTIGSVSIAAPLLSVPLNPPGIAVPSDYSLAGEVDAGAHVGDLWGTVLVAGRAGDVHGAQGALYPLQHVAPGDTINLTDVNGLTCTFKVDTVTKRPRTDVLPATLFAQTGPLRLVILTAADPVFFGAGLITYRNHVIVTATAT